MPFLVQALDTFHDFVIGVARALLPTRDWSKRKTGWKFLRVVTMAVNDVHARVDGAIDDLLPDRASEPFLARWAFLKNVTRKPATVARKAAALRVYGTAGVGAVEIGMTLTHRASGLQYVVTENEAIVAGTYIDVDIEAVEPGSAGRLSAGEKLYFDSIPTGIEEEAELTLDIDDDGDDQESLTAWRDRIVSRFRDPPLGGARADYETWSTELTGIATAYVYPLRQGLGSVDVAALHNGRGSARLLSGGELTELEDHLDERKPVGVTLRVLVVEETLTDVDVRIKTNGDAAYEFDWDDATTLSVSAWNGTTRELQFSTPRPASMAIGGRLTISPLAGGGDGVQHVIEQLVSTDRVILEDVPATAPVAGDSVYAGGPLVDPIRDAILEHFDELGTSNTDAQIWGPWEANLRPENIARISQSVVGVRKTTVDTPAATVEPADDPYPDDSTVYMLSPRRVLVRKDHS